MSFEFAETFVFLFTGRGLFIAASLIVAGFFVGATCRALGVTIWSVVVLAFALMVFASGEYFTTIDYIHRTGSGGFSAGALTRNILILGLLIYTVSVFVGAAARKQREKEIVDAAAAMGVDDFVRIIDLAAAHPEVGQAGWLVDRWKPMETKERRKWVSQNLMALRHLEISTEGDGIESLYLNLPGELAYLDGPSPKAMWSKRQSVDD